MVRPVLPAAVRTERVPPTGARRPVPPLPPVAKVDRPAGRAEHQRSGQQILLRDPGVEHRIQGLLGDRQIPGVGYKLGELRIGHRMLFDGERGDGDAVHRRLFRIEAARAHPVRSARQFDELGEHAFQGMPISKSSVSIDEAASNPAVSVGACT